MQAPDEPSTSNVYTVNILPALPSNWPSGSVKGVRLRGGLSASFGWGGGKVSSLSVSTSDSAPVRNVQFMQGETVLHTMVTGPSMNVKIL